MNAPEACVRCGRGFDEEVVHRSRGLCRSCGRHEQRNKNLADWPRLTWPGSDLLAEVHELMTRVPDHEQDVALCRRLGTTPGAVSRAASRAGDHETFLRFERAHQRLRRVKARS